MFTDREILGSEPCWQYLLASNAVPGFIQLVTLPWFPESPRYLLIDRGDKEACVNGADGPAARCRPTPPPPVRVC